MEPDYKKITQIINYLVRKDASSSSMPELKVIKLVWAADRYHLRKYARTVSGDQYYAMINGPVGSMTKDIAEFSDNSTFHSLNRDETFRYLATYIKYEKNNRDAQISSINDVDKTELSDTDCEALEFAWNNFGKYDYLTLINITHKYPEWINKQKELKRERKRVKMNLLDFFKNLDGNEDDPFFITNSFLKTSRQIYKDYA